MTRPAIPWGAVVLTAALLCWPAWLNGAALIYADSMHYLQLGLGPVREFRPRAYGWTAGALARATGSLWPVVAVQAGLIATMLHAALRLARPDLSGGAHLLAGAGIALFTTAPWMAGYVMPDALTAPGLLALFLVLALPPGRGVWVGMCAAVLGLAAASHPTHLWALPAVILALLVLRAVPGLGFAFRIGRAGIALGAIALGLGGAVLVNRAVSGQAEYTRGGAVFFASRLAGDALLQRRLAEICPDPRLPRLCPLRDVLPTDEYLMLWDRNSPVRPGDDFFAMEDELAILNAEVLRAHGWEWTWRSLRAAWRQARQLAAGDGLERGLVLDYGHRLAQSVSAEAAAQALASRQAREELRDHWTTAVAGPVGRVALLLCLGAVLLRGRRLCREQPQAALLLAIVLAGAAANAGAIGFGGTPHIRYQARLAWLFPLAALVVLVPRRAAVRA